MGSQKGIRLIEKGARVLAIIFTSISILLFFAGTWYFTVLGLVFSFFLWGIKIVQTPDRMVVERFGNFHIVKKPGLRWLFPLIDTVRAEVPVWEQPIPLFEAGPSIDFEGGGTAVLKEPIIWVKVLEEPSLEDNVYKMVYEIEDWRQAIRENVETALRTHLNNMTVEDTIKAVFDPNKTWWKELAVSFPSLDNEVRALGLKPTRLTITDFSWDDQVTKTRQAIFAEERSFRQAELSVRAAKQEIIQKALESGGIHAEIARILVNDYGYESERAESIAADYVKYFKAAETGTLIDLKTTGGDLLSLVAQIVAVAQTVAKKTSKKEDSQKDSPPSRESGES